MKSEGLIFDIKRYSINDGPGIRTTVFFKGCPLSCWWCHNPEGMKFNQEEITRINKLDGKEYHQKEIFGKYMTVEAVMNEIKKENVFHEESGGGVTFSGGEPLFQIDFLIELIDACKKENIHITLDTSGYAEADVFGEIVWKPDLFLYDLKLINNKEHKKYTGVSNENILKNLKTLSIQKKKVIIRIPVVPGITDGAANIEKMKDFLLELKNENLNEVHLLPFHNTAIHKYELFKINNKLSHLKSLENEELIKIKKSFESAGFIVKTGG